MRRIDNICNRQDWGSLAAGKMIAFDTRQTSNALAPRRAASKASTSARVLYIAIDALQVAVAPSRSISGCAQ